MTELTEMKLALAEDFRRGIEAMNTMQAAGLPPDLDQDVRDVARIILDHGEDYKDTEYGDMTTSLLESLSRLVLAAAKGG